MTTIDPITGAGGDSSGPDVWTDAGLVTLALIWGVNFSVIKVALVEFDPLAFNALRFPLASLLLAALLVGRGPLRAPAKEDLPRLVALGLVGNVAYQLLFIYGIRETFAGNASLLLATTPVWTTLLSASRGHEHIRPAVWAGILGTVLGMVLVVMGSGVALGVGGGTLVGDLMMIAASMIWSLYTVGSRRLIRTYGSLQVTAWTLWIGALGLVVLGAVPVVRTPFADVSAMAWLGVAYAGFLAIGVAYALWYRGVQRLGNTRTAAFSNLVPVVALVVAWLWLSEVPSALQIAGAAVILASVSLARFAPSDVRHREPARRMPGA